MARRGWWKAEESGERAGPKFGHRPPAVPGVASPPYSCESLDNNPMQEMQRRDTIRRDLVDIIRLDQCKEDHRRGRPDDDNQRHQPRIPGFPLFSLPFIASHENIFIICEFMTTTEMVPLSPYLGLTHQAL